MNNKAIKRINPNNVINLKNPKETRICIYCQGIATKDNEEFNKWTCRNCGLPLKIRETSPERELKTLFKITTETKGSRIASKKRRYKARQNKFDKVIDDLNSKGVSLFNEVYKDLVTNAIITDFKVNLPKRKR